MSARMDFLYSEWQKGLRFGTLVVLSGSRILNRNLEIVPEGAETELDLC